MTVTDLTQMGSEFGARWGTETSDLNATLVAWPRGSGVAEHVNDEVDVLMVVITGEVCVEVDGDTYDLRAHHLLMIPKGARRRVKVLSDEAVYLNVHRRRTLGLKSTQGYHERTNPR